ncbi:hypothetical protein [Prosthecobacter sp.]|uniref:hypothetical protein n=1 Tax=Prosthecobacter sp. TaxID=1965333 RepID=UPI002AB981E9|nr:hypothetical protein [Prosthecobacter sp.]MDZ4403869.1 hypothetical protein [Prosthecobacter sp.]
MTKRLHLWLVALLSLVSASSGHDLAKLERSFWLNASLAVPKLGYWGTSFAPPEAPTSTEITNAARMLIERANPNRLYLIHHHELPVAETKRIFRDWRKACPASVEIVPALVLKMYDKATTPVFTAAELDELLTFFKTEIHAERIAVYDVLPKRDQGAGLHAMAKQFPKGLIRVGLQPDEPLDAPFTAAVEDTWSGFCHGLTNEDWQDRGFGRDTLRKWVSLRNEQTKPIAYDLIVVAWDYANTKRGEYPGYDDAHKNMPLPAGRNRLAVDEILANAKPSVLSGFSADLLIIELNSETPQHDGNDSFYKTLKAGRNYEGYYAKPWQEVCEAFKAFSSGKKTGTTGESVVK